MTTLPRLLGRRELADQLGIPLSMAERIMRAIGPTKIGHRYLVTADDVTAYLERNRLPGTRQEHS